ncbi:MAG: COX15/CtaA family protein [Thermoplasmata archaeon]|nr:COX15/CtaA family protein [Thermoplasmata archaeon]
MGGRGHDLFRYAAVAAFLLCYLTILLGGNVMASDSGLACPDWPTCHGSLAPPLSGGTGIEWSHRLSALALSVATASVFGLALVFERSRPVLLRIAGAGMATVLGQALLGGWVVESNLTVAIVLLHLGLATVLFGLLLVLALLANLREIPRRYLDWARHAAEERPPHPSGTPADSPWIPEVPVGHRQSGSPPVSG